MAAAPNRAYINTYKVSRLEGLSRTLILARQKQRYVAELVVEVATVV